MILMKWRKFRLDNHCNQRHIKDPIKHLWWRFFAKIVHWFSSFTVFPGKLHHKCLTGSYAIAGGLLLIFLFLALTSDWETGNIASFLKFCGDSLCCEVLGYKTANGRISEISYILFALWQVWYMIYLFQTWDAITATITT